MAAVAPSSSSSSLPVPFFKSTHKREDTLEGATRIIHLHPYPGHPPAYLICTDPNLPLEEVVQDYLWRWGIEVDHRDEKQLLGVGEAQVRTLRSARREPVFAVACYAKLLLAAAQRYGPDATQANLPLPKWRRNTPNCRITTSDLLRQVRQDLWADALKRIERSSSHFVNPPRTDAKCQKVLWPLNAAIDHAATG